MSSISITKLYALLVPKLGKETSENLTTFIEEKIKSGMENNVSVFATKADIFSVREDIASVKEDIAKAEGRLSEKIAGTDSRTMKWMFLFLGRANDGYYSFISEKIDQLTSGKNIKSW